MVSLSTNSTDKSPPQKNKAKSDKDLAKERNTEMRRI